MKFSEKELDEFAFAIEVGCDPDDKFKDLHSWHETIEVYRERLANCEDDLEDAVLTIQELQEQLDEVTSSSK